MSNATSVSITEASRNFSDFINRVAYRQESFFLIRGKKPVAELRPVASGRRLSELPALLRGGPLLEAGDWAPFRRDLEHVRAGR
ncbi:MAG: antitoxin [Candidatus Methylacidiphilales bacterium]|nr:antitoxin [Candidatus Methylacidiphilales bacterium]